MNVIVIVVLKLRKTGETRRSPWSWWLCGHVPIFHLKFGRENKNALQSALGEIY